MSFKEYRATFMVLTLLVILMFGCGKTITYTDPLTWGTINTPQNVTAGQPIVSKVQVEYSTTSFTVAFLGFKTVERSTRHFVISASANVSIPRGDNSANTMEWIKDTTYTLQTTLPGQYILDYVYNSNVVKSDTVEVR